MAGLFDLSGKTALVTGGSRGIGLMIASGLIAAGAKVYISSRKAHACDAAAAALSTSNPGQAIAAPADVSDIHQVRALAETIAGREDRLDILVNNAGATWGQPIDAFSEDGWDRVLDLNLKSPFFLVQAFLPLLRRAAGPGSPARILNVGSVDGLKTSTFENYSYGVSKAGLHHLTRLLAARLAAEGVNVNAIAPGPFETRMIEFALRADRAAVEALTPMRRLGSPDDMAGAAVFLCSRASAYVTGAVVPIDGGMSVAAA